MEGNTEVRPISAILDLPITAKVWSGIVVILLLSSLVGLAGISGVNNLAGSVGESNATARTLIYVNEAIQGVNRFIVNGDRTALDGATTSLQAARAAVADNASVDQATAGDLDGIFSGFIAAVDNLGKADAQIREARDRQGQLSAALTATASARLAEADKARKEASDAAAAAKASADALQELVAANGAVATASARAQLLLHDAAGGDAKLTGQAKMSASTIGTALTALAQHGPDATRDDVAAMQTALTAALDDFGKLPAAATPEAAAPIADGITARLGEVSSRTLKVGFALKTAMAEANVTAKRAAFAAEQAEAQAALGRALDAATLTLRSGIATFELSKAEAEAAAIRSELDEADALAGKLGTGAAEVRDNLAGYRDSFERLSAAMTAFDGATTAARELADRSAQEIGKLMSAQADRAAEARQSFLTLTSLIIVGALIAALAVASFLARSVGRPIVRMTGAMLALAAGDTEVELGVQNRKDEIGKMQSAIGIFRDNALERRRLEAEKQAEELRREARAGRVRALIEAFRSEAGSLVVTVGKAASRMQATADDLTSIASATAGRATSAKEATDQSLREITVVASSAEELSASIDEISRQISSASAVVSTASRSAVDMQAFTSNLHKCAEEIGAVVNLIKAIADQTDLLALNATIEAARAGEAGKGFSVVASEVKSLANQTAHATEEIAQQIAAMQRVTDETVAGVRDIVTKMETASEATSAIASSVVEQQAATSEISRSVQVATRSSVTSKDETSELMLKAEETSRSASDVLAASQSVIGSSTELRRVIDGFLGEVEAA
jgi:methyl-accepting chemotaxis protein